MKILRLFVKIKAIIGRGIKRNMWDVILGIVAFVCYFIYDWNESHQKLRLFHSLFLTGSILLGIATIILVLKGYHYVGYRGTSQFAFGVLCLLSFGVLIYTLFFALPMKETYVDFHNEKPSVCDTGMYALCRHPGFIWYGCVYLFLYFIFPCKELMIGTIVLCGCNFAYIVAEDIYFFPRMFSDYDTYKTNVPFLIPNRSSIKKCMSTLQECK